MQEADSPEVLDRFHSTLELADIIARQVSRTIRARIELDDLLSAAREGLLDAARRYDPDRGIPFRAYANFRVRGAVYDCVRNMSALPRRAYERLAALEAATLVSHGEAEHALKESSEVLDDGEAEAALDEHLAAVVTAGAIGMVSEALRTDPDVEDTVPDPSEAYERAELLAAVRELMNELEHAEAEVIRLHYFEGRRLEDVGAALAVSKSWASRLHTRAISRLSERMAEKVA